MQIKKVLFIRKICKYVIYTFNYAILFINQQTISNNDRLNKAIL